MKNVIAIVSIFSTGRYGRNGLMKCEIKPQYFKNGEMKKTKFDIIKEIEYYKKPYSYGNAKVSYSIVKIKYYVEYEMRVTKKLKPWNPEEKAIELEKPISTKCIVTHEQYKQFKGNELSRFDEHVLDSLSYQIKTTKHFEWSE